MTYSLEFDRRALKEWNKLGTPCASSSRRNLLKYSRILALKPIGFANSPTATAGYRLIYQVLDQEVVVFVIAIGKREREAAYQDAQDRIGQQPAD